MSCSGCGGRTSYTSAITSLGTSSSPRSCRASRLVWWFLSCPGSWASGPERRMSCRGQTSRGHWPVTLKPAPWSSSPLYVGSILTMIILSALWFMRVDLFFSRGNRDPERLSVLPKVTQPEGICPTGLSLLCPGRSLPQCKDVMHTAGPGAGEWS